MTPAEIKVIADDIYDRFSLPLFKVVPNDIEDEDGQADWIFDQTLDETYQEGDDEDVTVGEFIDQQPGSDKIREYLYESIYAGLT